ncbi:MAG: FtsW/RodA/SpoVE family cell cycle protein, partial [candidate division WS1 bacterium]|nr:FtsW/RodA/SpoVE family cell cycle protein [candidate division WS1 bacterium]
MTTLRPAREQTITAPVREPRARLGSSTGAVVHAYWWQWADGRRYFLLVYALALLGLLFVFSSSFPRASRPTNAEDPFFYFRHQFFALVLGMVLMLVVSHLRLRHLQWLSLIGMGAGMLLVLSLFKWGVTVSGACNWLSIGGVRFQPAELTKVAYIGFMAYLLAYRSHFRVKWRPLAWMVGGTLALVFILIKQNDLGMAMLIMGIALGMALLGGLKFRYWILLLSAIAGLGLLAARMEEYRWARIEAWLDLANHRSGVGYHVYGMLISLARGGPFGTGFGMSREKWTTLPVPHTDSIFCVVGGELGLWGALGLIVLMTLLSLWAFHIARTSASRLGWYLAAGSGLALSLQAFINIAVATAPIPV